MSARAVGRVALVGLAIGLIAVIGEASGVAPAWAVLAGFAVSVHGAPPVAPRGVTALAAGVAALAVLRLAGGAGASTAPAAALTAGVLVTGGGLAGLRDDSRVPALAVLLGGSTVLAGAHVSGGTGVADVAPALAGLLAGILPMQVGELVTDLRAGRLGASPRGAEHHGGAGEMGAEHEHGAGEIGPEHDGGSGEIARVTGEDHGGRGRPDVRPGGDAHRVIGSPADVAQGADDDAHRVPGFPAHVPPGRKAGP